MVDSLGHLNVVQLIQDVVGVANEVLVNEIHELVLSGVLNLTVALGLAEGDEFLAIEIVHVDLDLAGHALAGHGLTSVAEEVEVFDTAHLLQALHDALANEVALLGVCQNAHGFIQAGILSAEMSLDCSTQHLSFLLAIYILYYN